jgi:hypothetical protein
MGGPLQAADDMVRILANSMTFGGADKIASYMGEKDTAAKTAAARSRAGVAGDAASLLGLGGDLKLAGMGLKALPKIAGAVISKKGALAAGLGLGTLAEYNARTGAEAAPAPKAPAAAAVKQPTPAQAQAVAEHAAGARAAQEAQPAGFDGMVAKLAAGQGGMISLRQLGALSDAAQRASQADYYSSGGSKKAAAPGDMAGRLLEQQYMAQYQKALGDPKVDQQKAADQFETKVLQLRKSQFIDPYGLHDGGE